MKIGLLTSADSFVDIVPEVGEKLEKEIIDSDVKIVHAPSLVDIPVSLKKFSDFDVVIVLYFYDKEDYKLSVILEDVIQWEMNSGVRVIKAFELIEDEGEAEQGANGSSDLGSKWVEHIINVLFHPEKFEQKEEKKRREFNPFT